MRDNPLESMDKYEQKIVRRTETRGKESDVKNEEDRYHMEEDENSIYEYDLGCLNQKRKKTRTEVL